MKSKMVFSKVDELTEELPLYVSSVGYWDHQVEMVRLEGFPDFQYHQVISGEGELWVEGSRIKVGAGNAFILYPGVPHTYRPLHEPWELAWVSFNGREAARILVFGGIHSSGVRQVNGEMLLSNLWGMLAIAETRQAGQDMEFSKLLYALLLDLSRQLTGSQSRDRHTDRLAPVLQYIEANMHRPLSLQELADTAGITPQYLCLLFKKSMNIRPMMYVNQERVNLSKALMFRETGKRIQEISQMAGFEHPSYYSAQFKRYTGMSPEQFKQLHGLN
ncbi:AraC family transcriptional regulator [Paenibacillus wynnii]|uniref:AraC family transcriptional regulator n=1 Tax=Paenibacillus wynnii TaxID=268407 RepID=UPI002792AF95|nr:AraC family transcriptional regulator [Paenibacillus wynnii]MDQ0195159.1 AraC-like DNA-binding protein [Paenibacillus wynnii]